MTYGTSPAQPPGDVRAYAGAQRDWEGSDGAGPAGGATGEEVPSAGDVLRYSRRGHGRAAGWEPSGEEETTTQRLTTFGWRGHGRRRSAGPSISQDPLTPSRRPPAAVNSLP